MRVFYAVLAVAGLVGTWVFNLRHEGGAGAFVGAVFATPASSSIGVDVLVTAVAAGAFIVVEGRRLGMRWAWVLVPLSAVTAIAFAFPLFLAWREHHLRGARAGTAGTGRSGRRGRGDDQLLRPSRR